MSNIVEIIFITELYSHPPNALKCRSEAQRRAITSPAAGFIEIRPGVARSAAEGGRPTHTNNMKAIAEFFGAMNTTR